MMRKLATFAAALLIPGGLTALFGVWLYQQASRTGWGQRRIERARELAAPWAASLLQLSACRPHWPQLRGR